MSATVSRMPRARHRMAVRSLIRVCVTELPCAVTELPCVVADPRVRSPNMPCAVTDPELTDDIVRIHAGDLMDRNSVFRFQIELYGTTLLCSSNRNAVTWRVTSALPCGWRPVSMHYATDPPPFYPQTFKLFADTALYDLLGLSQAHIVAGNTRDLQIPCLHSRLDIG